MRICELTTHNIGLLGFGREGRATLDILRRNDYNDTLAIFSDNDVNVPENTRLWIGAKGLSALSSLDVLICSPGFSPQHPLRQAANRLGLLQTTATNLFLAELRYQQIPLIGITGSKGKSTTSVLTHRTLTQAGVASILVGNIGLPALDYLDEIVSKRLVTVMEMSSYQCADLLKGLGPNIGCLLDLFPEHLDWHGDITAYYAAKALLAHSQRQQDVFLCNANSSFQFADNPPECCFEIINQRQGLHFNAGWFYRGDTRLFADTDMLLRGDHNRQNAVAALAVAEKQGAKAEDMQTVLSSFNGLPFRLQNEGMRQGIHFINDSLSTAPQAAAAALQAIGRSVTTLIAGGYDRGYEPLALVTAIEQSHLKTLILIPETGNAIARCVRENGCDVAIYEVETLAEAVALAFAKTEKGATCLFSPGAPSYNMYASFEERGNHFRALLDQLNAA